MKTKSKQNENKHKMNKIKKGKKNNKRKYIKSKMKKRNHMSVLGHRRYNCVFQIIIVYYNWIFLISVFWSLVGFFLFFLVLSWR